MFICTVYTPTRQQRRQKGYNVMHRKETQVNFTIILYTTYTNMYHVVERKAEVKIKIKIFM